MLTSDTIQHDNIPGIKCKLVDITNYSFFRCAKPEQTYLTADAISQTIFVRKSTKLPFITWLPINSSEILICRGECIAGIIRVIYAPLLRLSKLQ